MPPMLTMTLETSGVLCVILVLLATGLVSCLREMRRQSDDDRLHDMRAREHAARTRLVALARSWPGKRPG